MMMMVMMMRWWWQWWRRPKRQYMSHCSTGLATLSSPIRTNQSRKHNQTTQTMANLVSYATLGGLFFEHVVMLSKILKSLGEHSTMMLLLLADQWSYFRLCPESRSNKHSAQHSNVMNSTNICDEHWKYFFMILKWKDLKELSKVSQYIHIWKGNCIFWSQKEARWKVDILQMCGCLLTTALVTC